MTYFFISRSRLYISAMGKVETSNLERNNVKQSHLI